jgi:hypothetical protein
MLAMNIARAGYQANTASGSRWLAIVVLTVSAVVIGWAVLYHERWLAAYWLQCLHSAPEEEVPALIQCLGALEDDGLPALVACLGSSRQVVRERALAYLKEQIRTWEAHPDQAGDWQRLADLLAESAPVFQGWASQQAAVLAEMLLRARLPDHVDRMKLAASCKEVFRRSRGEEAAARRDLPLDVAIGQTDRLPRDVAIVGSAEPATNNDQEAANPAGAANEPRRLGSALGDDGTRLRMSDDRGAAAQSAAEAFVAEEPATDVSPAVWEDRSLLQGMDTAAVLSLFRELHPDAHQAAQAELTRRGFKPSHVELARHLADPNPAVRRQWAEQLPRLASIDPRPWLWWLTTDRDADVRHAAFSLLATSNDLSTRRRLVETARSDPDPRIQALGTRLAEMAQ